MRFARSLKIALIIVGALGGTALAGVALARAYDRYRMPRVILNVEKLPDSAKVLECRSWGFSDALIGCTLRIDPTDFPKLLSGRRFESFDKFEALPSSPLEARYAPGRRYHNEPAEFEHGGSVDVYGDAENGLASIYLYEE